MPTKIPVELSSTPGIVDNSNATAITIDSSERVNINKTSATTGHPVEIQANTAGQGMGIYGRSSDDFSFLGFYENGANTELSSLRSNSGFLGINTGGTQRLRIDSDGLKFGSDTAAANALDDYEYGTWTPAFQGASGIAYSEQTGYYIKIGDQVTLSFRMNVTTAPTSGSNIYIIMPYNPKGTGTGVADTRWSLCTGTTLSDSVAALTGIANYASVANFYQYNSKNGSGYFNYTNFGTGLYSATLTYRID